MFKGLKRTFFRRSSLPVTLAAIAITLLVIGFNYYVHVPLEQNAEKREMRTLSTLLDGYARQVEEQMIGVETTLAALSNIASDRRYSPREKHLLLKQSADALDIVRVFGITDVNGRIIHSSRNFPAPDVDLSQRDYIKYFLDGGQDLRVLTGPVKNLVDGRWQISLARAIRDEFGALTGVITTVIDPGTMIDRIAKSSFDLDYVTLLDRNFNLVARKPAKEEMIGKSMANAKIYTDVANAPDGHVADIYPNVFTGEIRFGVGERVFHDYLVISTSRPYGYAMQYWTVFSSGTTIASIVVLFFVIAILWVVNMRAVAAHHHNEELKQINEKLAVSRSRAERLARIKEDFLANMSHEIRTPMNAIFGLTQLLKRTQLEQHQHEYVRQIGLSGKFLLGVIDEILTFSKIEANELVLDKEPFSLPDVIDNVGSIMSMTVNDKEIEVVINVAPDVPKSIVGDSHRTQQILVNLVSNAIKFTESGYVKLDVRKVSSPDTGDHLLFVVSDTGIGIPEAQQHAIFDPFTQADASTTRKFGGTGLGLAISQRLAKSMDGNIDLSSMPGKGSTFTFKLPLIIDTSSAKEPLPISRDNGLRILIVDDQALTRTALGTIAKSLFIQADTVESGQKAIEMVKTSETPYDVLMIDWQMPGLDGLETIEQLKALQLPHMPAVIMVTAYERDLLSQVPSAHDVEMLTKPVTGSSFLNAISAVSDASSVIHPNSAGRQNLLADDTLSGVHILLAEDNAVNQQVAVTFLTSIGAEVSLAENGVEAVDAVEKEHFDIVLMDIQMPEMTGIEATRHIRATHPELELPIVALSAGVLEDEQKKCKEAGMNDFIGKPFDFENIAAKILHHLPEHAPKTPVRPKNTPDGQNRTPTPVSQTPVYDPTKALELVAGNKVLYQQLRELFKPQARDCQKQIDAALAERDSKALLAQFHFIKGSASQIAALRVSELAAILEQLAAHEDIDGIASKIDTFKQALNDTLAEFEKVG
ncbi:hybrid sensor histidine kinase/response regulator [Thalassospira australica]|uniref:hybrid sensor histidine kinase/response regulator n=1 Tax=Thalassospira australica TaxID=1528106 RepID=UPI0006893ED9|nr:response regulator [Thalassospira australica]